MTDIKSNNNCPGNTAQLHPVLDSARLVTERSRRVKINACAINQLARALPLPGDWLAMVGRHWLNAAPESVLIYLQNLSLEERVFFFLIYHASGFSYWSEKPWSVKESGNDYNGALGWLICMSRQTQILDANFLCALSFDCLEHFAPRNMPMLSERLNILRQLGAMTKSQEAKSSLLNRLTTSGAALERAFWIGKNLPGFDDFALYADGLQVPFLKRAQLLVSDLNFVLGQEGRLTTFASDRLTAFADYKIPQLLRHKKVLTYDQELSHKVDNQMAILPGSAEEVEIRACSIIAVEMLKEALVDRGTTITAAQVDNLLWLTAQQKQDTDGQMAPYHRCRTIYY